MSLGLGDLVAPQSVQEFFASTWNKSSALYKGDSDRFRKLFSWPEVNRLLREHRLEPPHIRLAHEGKSSEELSFMKRRMNVRGRTVYKTDLTLLYKLLSDGASMVLDAVDEMSPSVTGFCESLGRDLELQVSTNAYATWGNVPGFGIHWDDHDLFVLQIEGRKHWQLFKPTRAYPIEKDFEKNPFPEQSELAWEAILEPGDVIYIPRGHWHGATGIGEPTLHLTVGFSNPNGMDLLNWLVGRASEFEIARRDLPRFGNSEERREYVRQLSQLLSTLCDSKVLEGYEDYRRSKNEARIYPSFPFAATASVIPDGNDFIVRASGISATQITQSGDVIEFEAGGKHLDLAASTKPVIREILTGKPVAFETLLKAAPNLPVEAVRKIIEVLVTHEIAYIVDY